MKTDKPSEEILNAFVDGEFCPEERLAPSSRSPRMSS